MTQSIAHVFVSGRVQGVCFRESMRAEAQQRRITGWVRNLLDGRVEAVFEGDPETVRHMVGWCHHGPPKAHVTHVSTDWAEGHGKSGSFEIR